MFTLVKERLQGEVTLVLENGAVQIVSHKRGVEPLLDLLDTQADFSEFVAGDKIVGRAAAMLYVRLHLSGVYARVMTAAAKAILDEYGIPNEWYCLTDRIVNREGTDICPMERAVENIFDPEQAERAIRAEFARRTGNAQ